MCSHEKKQAQRGGKDSILESFTCVTHGGGRAKALRKKKRSPIKKRTLKGEDFSRLRPTIRHSDKPLGARRGREAQAGDPAWNRAGRNATISPFWSRRTQVKIDVKIENESSEGVSPGGIRKV